MIMHTATFDESLDKIVLLDPRYHRESYHFVREALEHTQKLFNKAGKAQARQKSSEDSGDEQVRHVSGQQLLDGIRLFALDQFGPMALTVLEEWGVHRCEDFGEIVFNMVENSLLHKTKQDTREAFKGGYDFTEAFRHPFLPGRKAVAPPPEPTAHKSDPHTT